jgi:hypothetical protein
MSKKVLMGTVAVFVTIAVIQSIAHGVLLQSAYEATKPFWRDEMRMWLYFVSYAVVAYFFTWIFSKGYEGKGMAEGLRYGFAVGMIMSFPMAFSTYASMPIPYTLALQWFFYGLITYIVAGIVVAKMFGNQAAVAAVK